MAIPLFLKALFIPFFLLSGIIFYSFFPQVKQDNKIEEALEEVVMLKMGMELDFSPSTPEV